MKKISKLIVFLAVFITVMAGVCTVSFAADSQYTDDLIPAMTSNTSPSGIVSASGYLSTGSPTYDPYKAFNKNTGYYDYWCAATYNGWLAYEFSSPQIITKYTLSTAYNNVKMFPKDWTFEAWNGSSWIVLDTRNNITDWIANIKKEFYFNNSTTYSKYRINISMATGGAGYSVIIGEMEMMASIVPAPTAPLNPIAKPGDGKVELKWDPVEGATSYNIKRSTISGKETTIATTSLASYIDTPLTNETKYYYVVSSVNEHGEGSNSIEVSAKPFDPNVTQYTDDLIPAMTSNTAPSGIVSASGYLSTGSPTYDPYKAFNKNTGYYDYWCAGRYNGWLAYEFSSSQVISKYTLRTTYNYVQMFPKDWTFEAWDGSSWIILDTQRNVTDWVANVKKEFNINNSKSYGKYRINISMAVGGTGYSVIIGEMEMMASIVTAPTAPTNLEATAGNKKVDLKWNSVERATSYNIKRTTVQGQETILTNIPATTAGAITYTDEGLDNGTTYYYVVSAVNAGGESQNSNEASATPTAPLPTSKLKLVLEVKTEKQLSISDELSDNTEMDWVSSDVQIATVDTNGMVKALKPGDTVITCTSKDKSYTEVINVLVVDLEYQLAVDLTVGDTCRLTIDDLKNTTIVTWTSYDPTIATVSAKGKVTAVSEGLTYIVATDKDGKEIGRIYIRVRQ